jgi:pimeloyl-ACP methyl ester carboxylesterase
LVRESIEEMVGHLVAVIRALGHDRIDLPGLSMVGIVAQAVTAQAPRLIAVVAAVRRWGRHTPGALAAHRSGAHRPRRQ